MRVLVPLLVLGALVAATLPAQAQSALPPGDHAGKYSRWYYPSQVTYGPIEDGQSDVGERAAPGAFLTLPFMGPHYITSIFDHCGPNYAVTGRVCRYDGTVASASIGGPDPTFDAGYAQTPGGHDYLYYSGHDGYDYGLYYEPVAAAAPGRVILARLSVAGCSTCLSGLTVEIDHGNGLLTFYGHLSRVLVRSGQYVARGQVVGISGMSGTATGPHLHFGVYYLNGGGPVDPFGWSGQGADPYPKDLGDLWISGSPRFASIPLPRAIISAAIDEANPSAIDVAWSSPGDTTALTVDVVTADGVLRPWKQTRGAGSATLTGRPGQSYWFWLTVSTSLGWSDGAGSTVVRVAHLSHGTATT